MKAQERPLKHFRVPLHSEVTGWCNVDAVDAQAAEAHILRQLGLGVTVDELIADLTYRDCGVIDNGMAKTEEVLS